MTQYNTSVGRRSSVKSVLRHYVKSRSDYYPNDIYVLGRDRVWRRCQNFSLPALLFKDKDEAERFAIQYKLMSTGNLWSNATVEEIWLEL